MAASDAGLGLAARVEAALEEAGHPALLIGAAALAAHGYPRHTEDIDLAVALHPRDLNALGERLKRSGTTVEYEPPDPQDPLGGVLTIRQPGALPVQVVNFDNPPSGGFPALVKDALARSSRPSEAAFPGRLPLPEDLILFTLYAGGPKSELDILELLTRCPVDLERLRELARGYRMSDQLEHVLSKVGA